MKNKWYIDSKNFEMCRWAYTYLSRRFGMLLPVMAFESEYEYCIRVINNQQEGNDRENLLKKIQAAWRQKKYKKIQMQKGKIPCSFMLSTSTLRNLDRLSTSSGETINETLESIINGTYLSDKENKKKQLAEKKQRQKVTPPFPILKELRRRAALGDSTNEEPEP